MRKRYEQRRRKFCNNLQQQAEGNENTTISVVFSDPQIMMVGDTFQALTERGADFQLGALDWTDQGRACRATIRVRHARQTR